MSIKHTNNKFIEKAKLVHGDKYDYSKVEYINNRTNVTIICSEHGEFEQIPTHHLRGEGCPKCKYKKLSQCQLFSINEIIDRFKKTHKDKYDYSKVIYKGIESKVCIICPEHGEFWQSPWTHIKGCGCPKCASTLSLYENELLNILRKWLGDENVFERVRSLFGDRKEYDIVIPSHKLCIEYNGLYWHSDKFNRMNKNYHLQKTIECEKNGYQLIHIFEDEYIKHRNIVLSKLKNILGIYNNSQKINARKCFVKEINNEISKEFLEKNHIQGYANARLHLGLYYENNVIAVMSFKKSNTKNEWELSRFATDNNLIVRGGGGKLFKYFIRKYNPEIVKSFADRRWSYDNANNLYRKLNFELDKILPPDYKYFDSKKTTLERIHKFNCRKKRLNKKYGLPLTMTEREMTNHLKFYRIYDCGLLKYVWKNNKI